MDELPDRFARAERQGLIEIVRAHPAMPIGQLLDLIQSGRTGRLLGSLTLAECSKGQVDEAATPLHDKARSRAAHDAKIIDALRSANEPLSPAELLACVGGSAQDMRTALQRLTAAKKITRTWKARGQGYSLA